MAIQSKIKSRKSNLRRHLLLGSILLSGLANPALAQSIDPIREQPDDNRVDLATGQVSVPGPSVSIGDPSQGGMVYSRIWRGWGWVDDGTDPDMIAIGGEVPNTPPEFDLYKGGFEEGFYGSAYPLSSGNGNGGQIFKNNDGTYTHKAADGTSTVFGILHPNDFLYYPSTKTTAAGVKSTYYYKPVTGYYDASGTVTTFNIARLQSITNSLGYQIKFTYAGNTSTNPQSTADFTRLTSVTMINNGVDYCDPAADACASLTQSWPQLTFSSSQVGSNTVESVTDSLSRVTQFTINSSGVLVGVTLPGSSSADFSITRDSNNRVASITKGGITSNYSWTPSVVGTVNKLTGVRSDSLGTIRTTLANTNLGVIETATDALSHTTTYSYDSFGRESSVAFPEGNYEQYTYDARGNVTQATSIAKSGSGLTNVVVQAGFDTTCSNTLTCNKPNWTKDALGNQTDYTYSSTTGQLLTVTAPAASSGGVRPQVRYSFASVNAWYKNSGGTLVQSSQAVSKLTAVSSCMTSASCAGTADERKTTITYQAGSSSTPSNLLVASATQAIGDGSVSQTTANQYDSVGNLIAVDGPASGTADTAVTRYDALRRVVGTISPTPGSMWNPPNIATRITYSTRGQVTLTELGNTNGQTDTAWSGFTPLRAAASTYDSAGRKLTDTAQSGSTVYSLTQYSYDSRGRLDCVAQRMDPAQWGSQSPGCTPQTTGPNGPDRVTKATYNAANQQTATTGAYGTSDASTSTVTFNANGTTATVLDPLSNLTTFEYDGFDRQVKTRYPVTTAGSNVSSTTDYNQLTYDANGNVTQKRNRDGTVLTFTYDALNRMTIKGVPSRTGLASTHTRSVYYSYDLLGQLTSARFDSTSGEGLINSINALGQVMTTTQAMDGTSRVLTNYYDQHNNRTLLNFQDDVGFRYYYDNLDRIGGIALHNGGDPVYDNSGLVQTGFYSDGLPYVDIHTGSNFDNVFDALGRLTTRHLVQNSPSGYVLTEQHDYSYNPAGQLGSIAHANNAFAWTGHYNVDRNYTANGLNQYAAAGTASFCHDANGNLTSDGSNVYLYDVENRLVERRAATSSACPTTTSGYTGTLLGAVRYDPTGHMYETSGGASGTTRFLYDGDAMVAEYNSSGTLLRRYGHGNDADTPLFWFEGATTSWTQQRQLFTDHQGSVIAVGQTDGSNVAINKYDEFGIPQSGNLGRFQYTGQAWLADLGLYYYKARMYSPTLGRFMQTDPIGYSDGLNWMNYAHSDPVNGRDPSGTRDVCYQRAVYTFTNPFFPKTSFTDFDTDCVGFADYGGTTFADYFGLGNNGAILGVTDTRGPKPQAPNCKTYEQEAEEKTPIASWIAWGAEKTADITGGAAKIAVLIPGGQGAAGVLETVSIVSTGAAIATNAYIGYQTGNYSGAIKAGTGAIVSAGFGGALNRGWGTVAAAGSKLANGGARKALSGAIGDAVGSGAGNASCGAM